MEYRSLGRTGVSVSQLCLGAMMLGVTGNTDHDDSVKIIRRALDAGINFIDTADVYSGGESEQIVGKALADGRRENVVLATKVGLPLGEDPNQRGTSRRWITQAVEGSLRRLGTDWIDLYQIHRLDATVDIDETLGALTDLVHAGKIRTFGASTVPASGIVEAQWTAERRGRERFPDDLLGLPAGVDVGRVDEVDPRVERAVNDADGVVVVGVAPGAEHHGAEAEL